MLSLRVLNLLNLPNCFKNSRPFFYPRKANEIAKMIAAGCNDSDPPLSPKLEAIMLGYLTTGFKYFGTERAVGPIYEEIIRPRFYLVKWLQEVGGAWTPIVTGVSLSQMEQSVTGLDVTDAHWEIDFR